MMAGEEGQRDGEFIGGPAGGISAETLVDHGPAAPIAPRPEHLSAPTEKERFVEFQYAEMKDLTKHFLTLIAGTLVLTLTLADKVLGSSAGEQAKGFISWSWAALIAAFIFAGVGLAGIFFAALAAREDAPFGIPVNYRKIARPSYLLIDFAGVLYVVALCLLVAVGVLRLDAANPVAVGQKVTAAQT